MIRFIFNGILFLLLILSIYFAIPLKQQIVPKQILTAPNRTGIIQVNDKLKKAEVLLRDIQTPEDLAFDAEGFLYTGDKNGVIWKIDLKNGNKKTKYANTLGRNLGLVFHGKTLYTANTDFGLLEIDQNGKVRQLCSETIDGVKINLANALDVSKDGIIYLVDSTQGATFDSLHRDILTGLGTGRLIKYDPSKGQCETLKGELHFPNGISLNKEEDALIISEGSLTVTKYSLKDGKKVNFVNPPGLSDNIKRTKDGNFLIALPLARDPIVENYVHPNPILKQVVWKICELLGGLPLQPYAQIVLVDPQGKILQSWEDPNGEVLSLTSVALQRDGYLYLGSFKNDFIARLKL